MASSPAAAATETAGAGRACEVLILRGRPNLIREGKTFQSPSVMQTGGAHGMQTMDVALLELVRRGVVTKELALSRSSTPEDLKRLLGMPAAAVTRNPQVVRA